MERKQYEPTERQKQNWGKVIATSAMPTDEEFKAIWKRAHHGKQAGWGMGKRQWIVSTMTDTREYQMGLWQGRVDAARGIEYAEERNQNSYNLGYYRGYTKYESNRRGWDQATRDSFDAKYVNN